MLNGIGLESPNTKLLCVANANNSGVSIENPVYTKHEHLNIWFSIIFHVKDCNSLIPYFYMDSEAFKRDLICVSLVIFIPHCLNDYNMNQ